MAIGTIVAETFLGSLGWILIVLAGIVIISVIAYFVYQQRVYNIKVHIFGYIGANKYPQRLRVDRARLIKHGKMGEQKLWLKKSKVFRTAYGKLMGPQEYWFVINPKDGMWVNFVIGDLDAKLGVLDIEPTDPDVRTFYVNNSSLIEQKFNKQGLWEQFAPYIVSFILLIVLIAGGWIILNQQGDLIAASQSSVDAAARLQESSSQILTSLDNIISNGGLRNVPS